MELAKRGLVVLLLLAALVAFDFYSGYLGTTPLTGAVTAAKKCGADLASYPCQFVKDGKWNAIVAVGDVADGNAAAAVTAIAQGLQSSDRVITTKTKRASQVSDVFGQNVISIGTGCSNNVTRKIQAKFGDADKKQCWNPALIKEGEGAITLYDFGNGKAGLVVEGYTGEDMKRAAKVLQGYKDWKAAGLLKGKSVIVVQNSAGSARIVRR